MLFTLFTIKAETKNTTYNCNRNRKFFPFLPSLPFSSSPFSSVPSPTFLPLPSFPSFPSFSFPSFLSPHLPNGLILLILWSAEFPAVSGARPQTHFGNILRTGNVLVAQMQRFCCFSGDKTVVIGAGLNHAEFILKYESPFLCLIP